MFTPRSASMLEWRGGGGMNIFSLTMNLGVFLFPRGLCKYPPSPNTPYHQHLLLPLHTLLLSVLSSPSPHVGELTVKRCDYHRSVLTQPISSAPEPRSSRLPGPPQVHDHLLLPLSRDRSFFWEGKCEETG